MAKSRAFGTIRTLPSGRFQARYWHLGKQTSAGSSFATKADARAWLASVETDLNRGDHFDPSSGSVLFDAYAAEWIANRALRPRTRLAARCWRHVGQPGRGLVDRFDRDAAAWVTSSSCTICSGLQRWSRYCWAGSRSSPSLARSRALGRGRRERIIACAAWGRYSPSADWLRCSSRVTVDNARPGSAAILRADLPA